MHSGGWHQALARAALLCMVALTTSCASTGQQATKLETGLSTGEDTNEPVQGGINVQDGSEEDFIVNVGRRTFFQEGSAELDETARVTLDKQAQWLAQYPHWKVKLQGFADDPGSISDQKALSQKRADAVKAYLISKGVPPERLKAKGYGRDRLVGDCRDIECTAQNRRVITNPQETADF